MGRVPVVVDDASPLGGKRIDVAARAGWVVRCARLTSPHPMTLRELSKVTGASVSRLQRLETGARRDGALVDAYEDALGLAAGSLRAPIDITCRTFPADAPTDAGAASPVTTVEGLSELTERLLAVVSAAPAVSGGSSEPAGTWLRWSRAISAPGAIGLPRSLAGDLALRLVGDMNRSVGAAYPIRYEALALLRCGDYGRVVVDAARSYLAHPDVQMVADLTSAVSEHESDEATTFALDLLEDSRDQVFVGGVLALENLAAIASDPEAWWASVTGRLVETYAASVQSRVRWEWMSHLLRLAPPAALRAHARELPRPPAPTSAVTSWTPTRGDADWGRCTDRARAIGEETGLGHQPMLARLLFDIAVGPHESCAVTSYLLVAGVPGLAASFSRHVAGLVEEHPDEVVRARALRRLVGARWGSAPASIRAWLTGPDADLRSGAVALHGAAGEVLPRAVYTAAIGSAPAHRTRAFHAMGMAGHESLASSSYAEARWWHDLGPRLTE